MSVKFSWYHFLNNKAVLWNLWNQLFFFFYLTLRKCCKCYKINSKHFLHMYFCPSPQEETSVFCTRRYMMKAHGITHQVSTVPAFCFISATKSSLSTSFYIVLFAQSYCLFHTMCLLFLPSQEEKLESSSKKNEAK